MSKVTSKTLDDKAMQSIASGNVLSPEPKFSGKTETHVPTTVSGPMSVMKGSQLEGNLKTTKIGGDNISTKGANDPSMKKKGK